MQFSLLARFLLGQLAALAMAATGVFSTFLVNEGISIPVLQSLSAYLLIFIVYVLIYLNQKRKHLLKGKQSVLSSNALSQYGSDNHSEPQERRSPLSWWVLVTPQFFPAWRYAVIALFDLEATVLVVAAYKYTNLMSVQLLDCATIPFVVILSVVVFRRIPTRWQLIGAVIAISGVAVLVVFDAKGSSGNQGAEPLLGDFLCIAASACYAISNVACEALLKPEEAKNLSRMISSNDESPCCDESKPCLGRRNPSSASGSAEMEERSKPTEVQIDQVFALSQQSPSIIPGEDETVCVVVEYLTYMPFFGAALAAIQLAIFHRDSFAAIAWSQNAIGALLGFVSVMLFIYSAMPALFAASSATFANLSLLTADLFAIVLGKIVFNQTPTAMFGLAFVLTVGGLCVYEGPGIKQAFTSSCLKSSNAAEVSSTAVDRK